VRGGDHGLARQVGAEDHVLLDDGRLFDRDLHTQVPARHHDPVGVFQNGIQIVQSLGPFQFGDDDGPIVQRLRSLAHGQNVPLILDKRLADRVQLLLCRELQEPLVILGESADAQVNAWEIDALVRAQFPA